MKLAMSNRMASVEELGLIPEKVDVLLRRIAQDVDDGLLPAAQVALARHGKVGVFKSFGTANDESLTCIFSATKGIVSAAAWLLFQEGLLAEDELVADIIPEFASHGKNQVTVKDLFIHTGGFPNAPFSPLQWNSKQETLARFAQWRLDWPPGTRFEYHASSAMWVVAELIERRGGLPYVEFIRRRVLDPLRLNNLFIGLPEQENYRALAVQHCGEAMSEADCKKLGMPVLSKTEITEDALSAFNHPDVRAVGVPSAGGFSNAFDLALFYQALIHGGLDGTQLWSLQTLSDARTNRTGDLKDNMFKKVANRGLGVAVSGDQNRTFRGFGQANSEQAFGHNGAGGQIAWADPATGISLAYLTPGHDRNIFRQWQSCEVLSNLAAQCAPQSA